MTESSAELRALIREVIRDQLAERGATDSVETVSLSTDEDLAAFVTRLLDLDEAGRQALREGRKRFRLAGPSPGGAVAHSPRSIGGRGPQPSIPVRRIERGAVTERVVRDAARAGERLVLGPGAVLTPLARDRARSSGVRIEKER
jgi:hypothetical protein